MFTKKEMAEYLAAQDITQSASMYMRYNKAELLAKIDNWTAPAGTPYAVHRNTRPVTPPTAPKRIK